MAQNDVATLQAEFSHATSMFEMWERMDSHKLRWRNAPRSLRRP